MNTDIPKPPSTFARRWILPSSMALLLCVVLAIPAARASAPPAEAPISSVPPLLRDSFSIFRTAPEVVPPEIAEGVATTNAQAPPVGGHGLNVALGQEIVLPGMHVPLWAVPGRDQVWLFDQPKSNGSYGGAGTKIARAVKRGVSSWTGVPGTSEPHFWRVTGLVPDGVTAVRLSKTAFAPVVNNAFVRKVDKANLWEDKDWIFIRGKRPAAHKL